MKTTTLKITGTNDAERSESLRRALESIGHSSANYEWFQGEPLYHGNPTGGFFAMQGIYFAEVIGYVLPLEELLKHARKTA
jgi:hypothetical protein